MIPTLEGSIAGNPTNGHLVLSRKRMEKIIVGDGPDAIVITVTDIGRDKVRIGVRAPRGLSIHREEVLLAIRAQQERERCTTPSI